MAKQQDTTTHTQQQQSQQIDHHLHSQIEHSKKLDVLFIVIFFTNLMINMDHGILPACTAEVREDLDLNNWQLGLLGSLVYLGLVTGSAVAMPVFNFCNTKFVLIVCLIFNAFCLFAFTLSDKFAILAASRFLVGFFQVFFCIYFPVWVDIFIEEKQRTNYMTKLVLGVPLGVILGYIVTAVFAKTINWRWSFYVQSLTLIPLALWFMITPARYIMYSDHHDHNNEEESKTIPESMNYINLSQIESSKDPYHRRDSSMNPMESQSDRYKEPDSPSFGGRESANISKIAKESMHPLNSQKQQHLFSIGSRGNNSLYQKLMQDPEQMNQYLKKHTKDYRNERQILEQLQSQHQQNTHKLMKHNSIHSRTSTIYMRHIEKEKKKLDQITANYSLCQKLWFLITHFQFMTLLFSLTMVFFISTGIQFWITDYWVQVLNVKKERATICFSVLAITGPVIGVICGGHVFSKIGGYTSPKAFPLTVLVMTCGAGFGFPSAFVDNFYLCMALLWSQFFCGGFCMPVLTGILLNIVPVPLRTQANSIANLVYNLVGYFPAPYVYGAAYFYTGEGTSRWGLISIQIACLVAPFLMIALLVKMQAKSLAEKLAFKSNGKNPIANKDLQVGLGSALIDNEQLGQLHSELSGDEYRKNKQVPLISNREDSSDDDDNRYAMMEDGVTRDQAKASFKTPRSDRNIMEMSAIYSRSLYPISLGQYQEDEDKD